MMEKRYSCCVIGAGFLGTRIAGELYRLGQKVLVYDSSDAALHKVNEELHKQRLELIKRGLSNDTRKIDLKVCANLREAVRNADFIFEAISDDLALKQKAYKDITSNCLVDTIICSNTLNLDMDKICQDSLFKERIIGCRFLAPVYCIPFVEVQKSSYTSKETIEKLRCFLEQIGYKMKDKSHEGPIRLTKEDILRLWEVHKSNMRSSNNPIPLASSGEDQDGNNDSRCSRSSKLPSYMDKMVLPDEDSIEAMEKLREKQSFFEEEERKMETRVTTGITHDNDLNDLDTLIAANNEMGESGHFTHLNVEEGLLEVPENFDTAITSHNDQTEAGHIDMIDTASGSSAYCILCHIGKIDSVIIPCGHMWMCYVCANKLLADKKECPACRGEIQSVVRVYKP